MRLIHVPPPDSCAFSDCFGVLLLSLLFNTVDQTVFKVVCMCVVECERGHLLKHDRLDVLSLDGDVTISRC